MSRIFSIKGYEVEGAEKCSESNLSFSGMIVANGEDEFYGYCRELDDSGMPDFGKTWFVAGAFAENDRNGRRGIAFYKLSNNQGQTPLLYVMPDLDKCGIWAGLNHNYGHFVVQGEAKVTVSEETPLREIEETIATVYGNLNQNINGNGELVEQIYCCKDLISTV